MLAPVAVPLANAVVNAPPPVAAPPTDGVTTVLLSALAPVWPALEPWLIVGGAVIAMGIATEVVVRELQRTARAPSRARSAGR